MKGRDDFRAEIEFHVDMRAELNREAGAAPDLARESARRQFGNATLVQEEMRGMHVNAFLETVQTDCGVPDIRGVLATLDQSRWQPWFYQYLFMVAALGLAVRNHAGGAEQDAVLNTCRLILVSVYFWSGLQKANSGFLNDVFPWLVEPLSKFFPSIARFGLIVPVSAVGIGLALLTKRFRTAAAVLAMLMHAFILLSIVQRVRTGTQ